jgi:hypothetical protein
MLTRTNASLLLIAGLHVRRAVAELIEDPAAYPRDPDFVL